MTSYRELRNQNNDLFLVARGFNLPAMLFAPLWAGAKQFWPAAGVTLVVNLGIKFAIAKAHDADLHLLQYALFSALLGFAGLFGYYANALLTAYRVSKGWTVVSYIEAENEELAASIANDPNRNSAEVKGKS